MFVLHQACVFRDHNIFKQDFIGIGEGKMSARHPEDKRSQENRKTPLRLWHPWPKYVLRNPNIHDGGQKPFFNISGKYISQQPSPPKHDSTYTSPNNADHIDFGIPTGTPIQFIDSPTNAQIYADMAADVVPQNNNTYPPPSFLDVLQRGNQPNNDLPPFTANAFDDNLDWTNFSPQQPRL